MSESPKGDILSLNDKAKNLWASWGELYKECSEANRDPTVFGNQCRTSHYYLPESLQQKSPGGKH